MDLQQCSRMPDGDEALSCSARLLKENKGLGDEEERHPFFLAPRRRLHEGFKHCYSGLNSEVWITEEDWHQQKTWCAALIYSHADLLQNLKESFKHLSK